MESTSRLTSSTPMVRTHTLNPTSDAPRPQVNVPIRLLKNDKGLLGYSKDGDGVNKASIEEMIRTISSHIVDFDLPGEDLKSKLR